MLWLLGCALSSRFLVMVSVSFFPALVLVIGVIRSWKGSYVSGHRVGCGEDKENPSAVVRVVGLIRTLAVITPPECNVL